MPSSLATSRLAPKAAFGIDGDRVVTGRGRSHDPEIEARLCCGLAEGAHALPVERKSSAGIKGFEFGQDVAQLRHEPHGAGRAVAMIRTVVNVHRHAFRIAGTGA